MESMVSEEADVYTRSPSWYTSTKGLQPVLGGRVVKGNGKGRRGDRRVSEGREGGRSGGGRV